jgi:hypothetical protein
MTPNAAEDTQRECRRRIALLAEALSQLPPDAITLSAMFDLAVSAAIAVTFDLSTARLLFEAKYREYECRCGAVAHRPRIAH